LGNPCPKYLVTPKHQNLGQNFGASDANVGLYLAFEQRRVDGKTRVTQEMHEDGNAFVQYRSALLVTIRHVPSHRPVYSCLDIFNAAEKF